jgi:hypothetical protein
VLLAGIEGSGLVAVHRLIVSVDVNGLAFLPIIIQSLLMAPRCVLRYLERWMDGEPTLLVITVTLVFETDAEIRKKINFFF